MFPITELSLHGAHFGPVSVADHSSRIVAFVRETVTWRSFANFFSEDSLFVDAQCVGPFHIEKSFRVFYCRRHLRRIHGRFKPGTILTIEPNMAFRMCLHKK